MRVWTRQHILVLDCLRQTGRYTAKKEAVYQNEDAVLMLPAYDWLMRVHPDRAGKPEDADYPVWLSVQENTAMLPVPDTVLLELEIDRDLITFLNVAKWGAVNNFSYIPLNEEDARRHRKLIQDYGISDAKACMSQFYPEIRREIEDSWMRVFDDAVQLGNDYVYGLVWELKEEWIRRVMR